MPIQIKNTGSLFEVVRNIRKLEAQYHMTSDEFVAEPCLDGKVPEFDAIEWNFLLMQKRVMEEDSCVPTFFSARYQSCTSSVDTREWREDVAA